MLNKESTYYAQKAIKLLEAQGVKIVPDVRQIDSSPDSPPQTGAAGTLAELIKRQSYEHAHDVILCLTQIQNRPRYLSRDIMLAISDILRQRREWARDLGAFMDALDRADIPAIITRTKRMPKPHSWRSHFGAMILDRIIDRLDVAPELVA
ncbi:hypothetical protein PsAD5_00129 [Pseudovibrio sp. Ad5]|uniref:hypothetical protein n=1 Tax=unclassified Pseudovibrio TaxID=2627060 RepID=UPI00070D2736|nr:MULTISPECIES: hypothetical protein [unclassified Pseudovibrio]KZL02180.1 hypothetical protein PsAD5_00129 [Pseudovibrio sp. Ad5]